MDKCRCRGATCGRRVPLAGDEDGDVLPVRVEEGLWERLESLFEDRWKERLDTIEKSGYPFGIARGRGYVVFVLEIWGKDLSEHGVSI